MPKKMRRFRKCVNSFSGQIISLITPNLSKAVRKMCQLERKGEFAGGFTWNHQIRPSRLPEAQPPHLFCDLRPPADALRNLQCLKPKHRPLLTKCFDRYSTQLKFAAHELRTVQQMLPIICCGYLETKRCVRQRLDGVCGRGAPDTGGYLAGLADVLGKEMVGVACARHASVEQCDAQGVGAQLDRAAGHKLKQYEREFIMMPFIRASQRMVSKGD